MRQVELPWFITGDKVDLAIVRGEGLPDLRIRCLECDSYGNKWAGLCPNCGSHNVEELSTCGDGLRLTLLWVLVYVLLLM